MADGDSRGNGDGDGDGDGDVALLSLPYFIITGPNILPDDIYNLRQKEQVEKALPTGYSLSIDGNGSTFHFPEPDLSVSSRARADVDIHPDDLVDFKSSFGYDLDAVNEAIRRGENAPADAETLNKLLVDLQDIYIAPFKEKTEAEYRPIVYKMWELDELRHAGIVELKDIHKGFELNICKVYKIYMLFQQYQLVGRHDKEAIANQNIFDRVMKSIYYMNNMLVNEYHIRKNLDDDSMMNQEDTNNLFRYTPLNTHTLTDFQKLLIFLLGKAFDKGYRLHRETCYKQIYYNGYATHAWKPVMPVEAFVYECIDKDINGENWRNLTSSKDNARSAAQYLIKAGDKEFPGLRFDRHLFSFTNGVYDAKIMTFFPYETHKLSSDRVAIKFFNQPFDAEALYGCTDWYDIETPEVQNILSYQGLSPEVCRIVYAMMGRCIYEVGEMDSWEVVMFIKGVAGSGKSTLGTLLREFYPPSEVCVLSSNIEGMFGLGAIYDKLVYICTEVRNNWKLDQGEFQKMISGEDVSVPIKHKTAISIRWKVPGMLMGNEVAASWLDAAGSMTRRMILLEFLKRVRVTDTSLQSRIKKSMGAIIHKCNVAYHDLLNKCGKGSVWSQLPEYFNESKQKLAAAINPLEDFLTGGEAVLAFALALALSLSLSLSLSLTQSRDMFVVVCVRVHQIRVDGSNPDLCMPFDAFKTAFKDFARKDGYTQIRMTPDYYASLFEMHGLTVQVEKEREFNGVLKRDCKWVFGVAPKESEESGSNMIYNT
jgi:hypothetical protein